MLTPRELKSLLATQGIRLRKRLGQHHLVDGRMLERVAEACGLTGTETAVEIGAGLGALTERLALRARQVIAVEVDRRIAALLEQRMATLPNVAVWREDILDVPAARVRGAVIVGAIPYAITSPILLWLAALRRTIPRAILVLQAEVADRMLAAPGGRAYGRLSLLTQCRWDATRLFPVPRGAFFPQPRVDSVCVRLVPWKTPPVAVKDEAFLFEVIKAAFGQRRKQLANSLAALAGLRRSRDTIERALEPLKLPRTVRAEALSLAQFASLANRLRS